MRRFCYSFVVITIFLTNNIVFTQMDHPQESRSDVPELWEFHEVIYQIWHEAWPDKNSELLKQLLPDIEEGYTKLAQASLPGILHEKQGKWEKGIKEISNIISEYKDAAASNNNEALLKAAEDLHSKFEYLVRTLRPVLREIDHFHQELYRLYHSYLPDYDLEKIKKSTAELIKRMEALNQAQLPKRYQKKETAFYIAREKLSSSLQHQQKVIEAESEREVVVAAVEKMHSDFRSLMAVFE